MKDRLKSKVGYFALKKARRIQPVKFEYKKQVSDKAQITRQEQYDLIMKN
jgi:hypothetical protein